MAELTGKPVGQYRLMECIGHGQMATVYKAFQPALERYVAIKFIHAQPAAEAEPFLARFEREMKAVAALRHPHIFPVFDFGIEGGAPYIVMEYLAGTTLKARLNELALSRAIMPPDEVRRISLAVAGVLDHAHGKGVVHRDIKPANVMLTPKGGIFLTDFGIATLMGAPQVTAAGVVIGEPAYMAPEQGRGEPGDERSDIYALGVLLYEMVTGRLPFAADTPLAVLKKHINDPVPPPRQVNPAMPPAVERIILKALAKNPADRYQRSADMASELADALKAFEEPWPPEHIIVKVEGRVSAILDKGFSLDTGQGMTEIVSTLSRGDRLGLHPGDYVIVFGEYDLNHVLRSYANIRKVFPNGQVVIIKDEPYKRKRPWWEFW